MRRMQHFSRLRKIDMSLLEQTSAKSKQKVFLFSSHYIQPLVVVGAFHIQASLRIFISRFFEKRQFSCWAINLLSPLQEGYGL